MKDAGVYKALRDRSAPAVDANVYYLGPLLFGMQAPPQWQPFRPPGTFIHSREPVLRSFDHRQAYSVAAKRRVTHPSLPNLIDRAVVAAAHPENVQAASPELYRVASAIPEERRAALINRRPEGMIPFLRTAAEVLTPLQLLHDVPCVRLYRMTLGGGLVERIYPDEPGSVAEAPESTLTPAVVGRTAARVRYVDYLRDSHQTSWPASPLVLLSNAEVHGKGYSDIGRQGCGDQTRLLLELPTLPVRFWPSPIPVPESHADWGLAAIMQYALGR